MQKTTGLLLIIILPLLSCVYFNTLYNAQSAFHDARKSQLKRMETVTSDTVERLTADERMKFERAIEKSSKILDVYSQKKQWADDALFLIGESYYYMGEFPKAIRKFSELLTFYPQSPFTPEAGFILAKSYLENGDMELAKKAFEDFEKNFPQRRECQEIPLLMADAVIAAGGKLSAIEELNKVLSGATPQQASRIYFRSARILSENENCEEGLQEFAKADDKYLTYKEVYDKKIHQVRCLRKTGKTKDALEILKPLAGDPRYKEKYAEICFEQGLSYEALIDYKTAIKYYTKAAESKNQNSPYVAAANFRLARIYHQQNGDIKKAKEYYFKASISSDEKIREKALSCSLSINRIQELEKLLTHPDSASKDTSNKFDPCFAKYRIGELLWFQLEQVDSAMMWLNALLDDSTCVDAYGAKAAYSLALLNRDEKKDTIKSTSLFNLILSRFSISEEAKGAQKELGQIVSIKTKEDSAHNAFLEAENLLWGKETQKLAAAAFDSLANQFTISAYAPKASYTSAWIYDEILNDTLQARLRYEKTYKKWPDTDYAKSAKQKLMAAIKTEEKTKNTKGVKAEDSLSTEKAKNPTDSLSIKKINEPMEMRPMRPRMMGPPPQ
jgi:tetratricopeptide (TPR) repeat protein